MIFGFRQADAGGMRRLARRFPGHKKVLLRVNYRSKAEIVAAASRCVRHNTGREPRALIAERGGGGLVRLRRFGSDREEAGWIAAQVGRGLQAGWHGSEILILCRNGKRMPDAIEQALCDARIPHRVLGRVGFYEREEVKNALAYLTLVANPRDVSAFRKAVGAPARGIGGRAQDRIVALARKSHDADLISACGDQEAGRCVRGEPAREKLRNFASGFEAAREQLGQGRSLARVTAHLLEMRGGIRAQQHWITQHNPDPDDRADAARALEDLRSLQEHVASYEQQEPCPTLTGFLELVSPLHWDSLEDRADGRVTIATIHKAKGMEARLVIVIGCEEGALPAWQSLQSKDPSLEEERRVFYVAATRAKDMLYLTYCSRRGGRPAPGPSRFLAEAGLIETEPQALSA